MTIDNDTIRNIARECGFTLREQDDGTQDLNPYVYEFARKIFHHSRATIDQVSSISNKPILSMDFDGVIHSYTSGWQGVTLIPDPPVDGAMEFLRQAVQDFEVHVFSTRSRESGGIDAMREYIESSMIGYLSQLMGSNLSATAHHARSILEQIQFPILKPKAHVGLDDRIITFMGQFPTVEELKAFKPWNRREE